MVIALIVRGTYLIDYVQYEESCSEAAVCEACLSVLTLTMVREERTAMTHHSAQPALTRHDTQRRELRGAARIQPTHTHVLSHTHKSTDE